MCDWPRVALCPQTLAHARPHLPLLATLLIYGLPTLLTYLAPAPPPVAQVPVQVLLALPSAATAMASRNHKSVSPDAAAAPCTLAPPVAQVLLALPSIAIVMASCNKIKALPDNLGDCASLQVWG